VCGNLVGLAVETRSQLGKKFVPWYGPGVVGTSQIKVHIPSWLSSTSGIIVAIFFLEEPTTRLVAKTSTF
jgi:hypothetical protein